MPLRKIALVNNEYYHVFNRSIGKRYIFLDERANLRFIKLIQYYKIDRHRLKFSLFNRLPLSTQFHILKGIDNEQQKVKILSYYLIPASSGIVKSVEKLGNYPWSSYGEYISGALKKVSKVCDISDI